MPSYSSPEFEERFTYPGSDLGAVWSPERTLFRVWVPTAEAVRVNLYRSGNSGVEDLLDQFPMAPAENGTWVAEKQGNLDGIYYTYTAMISGEAREACDPYARTTGANGKRAMVLDLTATNPPRWDTDRDPHFGSPITDAVIYELHLRDLSMDPHSGIRHKGKFLGLAETGTVNSRGIPTGLDHIRSLGVTHVHLLPVFDYGSVDEARPDVPQFNWGYDPMNFNVPEGSYSTDPFNGAVRIREMKQMVQALHDNGLSVVMDVVYNHVYDAENFCFNRLVPRYFSRVDENGEYANGSGCGNDTASERSMVRKYIVDSVKYWASEYHIDGFRFDLAGLMDVQTIRDVMDAVLVDHPNVIFYGEGWDMPTRVTKPDCPLATQANSRLLPGFAFFSDTMRDLLKGSVFYSDAPGFVSGAAGLEPVLKQCFLGLPDWCRSPAQSVNYASCHDDLTLFDRLALSAPESDFSERVRMQKLSAAVCMTAQGTPFFQSGEEMLRSKPLPEGGFDHNSYHSPDSVNALKWDDLNRPEYQAVRDYYRGLIAFRKAHPALRMTDPRQVRRRVSAVEGLGSGLAAFLIDGKAAKDPAGTICVIFNANNAARTLPLPYGSWGVCVDGERAGTEPVETVKGSVTLAPISAAILVRLPERKGRLALLLGAAGIAAAALAALVLRRKRK